jgi:stage II sporulation protein AA (anti-sigma F factor antagonist)
MTEAGVRTEETEPGRLLVRLDGEVDLENAFTVEERLREVITNRVESVTLDLGGLDYLASAGLRVLFGLANRLELLQIALDVVVPVGSPARKAAELSGLGAVVTLRAT